MDTREKWQRMTNPKSIADYGIWIKLDDLAADCPDIFLKEVAPLMPADFIDRGQHE